MTDGPRHMTPEEFRRHGREVVEWIAAYLERVEQLPVMARVQPGDIRARLPAAPPEQGESFDAILADVDRVLLPGITHWQSPNFYGFFPANTSGPAILGELLSAGLGVQGMLWASSPACTELETHVLDWLADLLGLPERLTSRGPGGGVIQDTASSATLCALIAARDRATNGAASAGGAGPLAVYASGQAHSSVEKAAVMAGLGRAHFRALAVDEAFALRPEALEQAIAADRAAGVTPAMVVATIGTTSSAAVDPLPAIGAICRRHGVWLHVDAAYAGSAAVCPEFRWLHQGLELADSYAVNPHKWLLTNFDCNALFLADRTWLIRSLSVLPEYLRNRATESGAVIDYRDWQVPLGRRFRALKLWFVIRWYGAAGLRSHIRRHVALAREFADRMAADPRFEIVAPVRLGLVCFRLRAGDEASRRLLDALNDSGSVYLSHTRLEDRFVLRLAVGGTLTERRHVEAAWDRIRESAETACRTP